MCIAFDKIDGSNFRAKYTQKEGFCLYGTRTQLINHETPFWGEMVTVFENTIKNELESIFKKEKEFRDFREIIVFGEFFGEDSFAGRHGNSEKKIILFDVLCGHKQRKFVLPQDFIKIFKDFPIPRVIRRGNLNEFFIQEIREDKDLMEGVICKGTERSGAFAGGVWQCKIKTNLYLQKLKENFGEEAKLYWE
jgi:hypothetical protein